MGMYEPETSEARRPASQTTDLRDHQPRCISDDHTLDHAIAIDENPNLATELT